MKYIDAIKSFTLHLLYLLFGIVFCALGIFYTIDSINFRIHAESISCEIVQIIEGRDSDNELCYDLYVSYFYDGINYDRVKVDDWNNPVQIGNSVCLYCNSNNPKDLRIYKPSILAIIINFLPFLFGLIPIWIGVTPILSKYQKMKLLKTGKVIYAEIDSIKEIKRSRRHRDCMYELNCIYFDEYSGKAYRFKEMLFSKSELDNLNPGGIVKVVVNPEDYSYYEIVL